MAKQRTPELRLKRRQEQNSRARKGQTLGKEQTVNYKDACRMTLKIKRVDERKMQKMQKAVRCVTCKEAQPAPSPSLSRRAQQPENATHQSRRQSAPRS